MTEGLLQNRKSLAEAYRAILDWNDPNPAETAVGLLRKLNANYPNNHHHADRGKIGSKNMTMQMENRGQGISGRAGSSIYHHNQGNIGKDGFATNHFGQFVMTDAKGNIIEREDSGMMRVDSGSNRFVGRGGINNESMHKGNNRRDNVHGGANGGGSGMVTSNPLYNGKTLSEIGHEYGRPVSESKSYMVLPHDADNMKASGMSIADRHVLNHEYVAYGTGTRSDQTNNLISDDPSRRMKKITDDGIENSGNANSVGNNYGPFKSTNDTTVLNGGNIDRMSVGLEDQRMDVHLLISKAQSTLAKLEKVDRGEIRSVQSPSAMDLKAIELMYRGIERYIDALNAPGNGCPVTSVTAPLND